MCNCPPDCQCGTKSNEFVTEMIELWMDHIYLTREFVLETVIKFPHAGSTEERLLGNQADLGINFGNLVGNMQLGETFAELLTQHIIISKEIVLLAIAKKQREVKIKFKEWSNNGMEISRFLSEVNPKIDYDIISEMFQEHLQSTFEEADLVIKGKDSIPKFEEVRSHMIEMVEYLIQTL